MGWKMVQGELEVVLGIKQLSLTEEQSKNYLFHKTSEFIILFFLF